MSQKSVLISGVSIAGPALAFWLERYGWQVTLVERADSLREGGQNIDVRGAGREVVRRMGLENAIRQANTGEIGTRFVDAQNRTIAQIAAGQGDTEGATAELEILRGDLAQILVDATSEKSEYIFGDSIATLTEETQGVRVTFSSGRERIFDAVVVAEGKNSRTRELLFDKDPLSPLGLYTAYLTIPKASTDTNWARWYNALGRRSITLRPDNKGTTRATFSFISGDADLEHRTRQEQKEILREVFSDAGWEAPRILRALEGETDMYFEYVGQVKLPCWSAGKVVLLGDAAYCASPVSGMGTSLSLVGAYILAGQLARTHDISEGFASYESIMRPYVKQAQQLPPGVPGIAHPASAIGLRGFHLAVKVATSPLASALGNRFFSPPAEKIDLPDYSVL